MELLLSLGVPTPEKSQPRRDVKVELDALTPVGVLRDALLHWAVQQGHVAPLDPVLVAISGGQGHGLAPEISVFDAGLISGFELDLVARGGLHRFTLTTEPPGFESTTPSKTVALDVTSGPEAGRSFILGPGRHVVGRAADCTITLDDASMSRQHFALQVSPFSSMEQLSVSVEPNPNATNGTFLDARRLDAATPWHMEEALFAGSSQMVLRSARPDAMGERDRLGQVAFNRLPYRLPVVRVRAFPALAPPPERPGPRRFPLTAVLVPLVGATAITWLTHTYQFLFLAALSPLMMVSNQITEGRSSGRNYARDKRGFEATVEARLVDVDVALAAERSERMLAAPDVPLLNRQAAGRLGRLWERPRASPDFLDLRLGLGRCSTNIVAPVAEGGDPDLQARATEDLSVARVLALVPVTCNLDATGVTGLWGQAGAVAGLGASLITQAATLHSPEDLVIVAAIASSHLADWGWLKWLPHTHSVTSPLAGSQLVDEDGADDLVQRLLDVVATRASGDRLAGALWPRVLFVCDESAQFNRATLATLLDAAGPAGVVSLWLGHDHSQLPRQCHAVLRCEAPLEASSLLRYTDPQRDDVEFDAEGINPATATTMARTLAPVRDVSAASATTGIPRTVSLFDLPGFPSCEPVALARQWTRPVPYGLVCELGTGPDGPFTVDLVTQGPHALVAGTSGAGKSELLQSLVLSLAARYSPQRCTFLFIDYKGGAASAQLGPLPHTVGQVTNLDERLALRALASLGAEVRRRMALLDGRAKDLAGMLEVAPAEAPPSLVIVVDEFATLIKEIPDFVPGIVDIAQRGRSLGIHLVLATQRPTGAISDNILANTNLRIALRVLDVADSRAIIDTGDAAGIPVPLRGRAFARTGPGPLELFQCAWSGAPHRPEEQAAAVVVHAYPFAPAPFVPLDGASADLAGRAGPAFDVAAPTQLAAVVAASGKAAQLLQLGTPRRPWVEPLPEHVSLEELMALDPALGSRAADPGRTVLLGLGDLPTEQRQTVVDVDLETAGGLLIFGSGGAGKTTMLRTVAANLARQGTPQDVQLYVFDFAGRALAHLEELPHVAAAATGDDPEKVTRMLTVLEHEIDRRHHVLGEAHAESISTLRAGYAPIAASLPRIVVLMDSYSTFHATFETGVLYRWITAFQHVVASGRQVGVHVVATNTRQLGLPVALTSAISARVVMRMGNADELVGLGVTRKAVFGAELSDGRCFVPPSLEVQAATVGRDPRAHAQIRAVATLAAELRAGGTTPARRLEELPDLVVVDDAQTEPFGPGKLSVGIGVADLTLEVVRVDLGRQNMMILGPPLSGRSNAVAALAAALGAQRPRPSDSVAGAGHRQAPLLVGLGALTSPLALLGCWDLAGFGRSAQQPALVEAARVVEGYEGNDVKLVLCIDSIEDLETPEHGRLLESLIRSDAVRVVASGEAASLERSYSGWTADLKRNRAVLVLQPETAGDVEAVSRVRPALRPGQPFPPGRGVLVDHGRATLIQVHRVLDWGGR